MYPVSLHPEESQADLRPPTSYDQRKWHFLSHSPWHPCDQRPHKNLSDGDSPFHLPEL